jgi:glycosyltransferase involved in cell wall biosynthesis/ubiquinone/menaquinone biosynthesis C-methylase UbiE
MVWLSLACNRAIELHKRIGFDIAHHVSYGTISAPPPVSKFPFPFVWGPVGGAQRAPSSFRSYFGRGWSNEIARNFRIQIVEHSPSLRKAAQASAVALATNHETAQLLVNVGARDVRLFLDSGIPETFLSQDRVPKSKDGNLTLLWVGRMQRRKALPLALDALAMTDDLNVRLLVVGDGEMRESWQQYARRLQVERKVEFSGQLPWDQMPHLYRIADAFLFTSLRDSFGMQVLEAMAHSLPIIAPDHQGVGAFIPTGAGIKVPVTNPRETVREIAEAIRWLANNPEGRLRMGEAGRAYAETQTWQRRAARVSELYEEVLSTRMSSELGGPASYGSYAVKKRMAKMDETIDLNRKGVLDLGCGNGCYTAELARRAASVCGVDIRMPNLRAFQEAIPRVQAAGENLPFAAESFDVVTMIEVLEHTRCDSKVLQECFRVLKPSGLLVLFVPNKLYPFESHPCHIGSVPIGPNIPLVSWLPEFLHKHLCHARIYTRSKLLAMANRAGFQIQKSGYVFPPLDSFPLPFKETYRRIARRLEHSPLARFGVSLYAVFQKPCA